MQLASSWHMSCLARAGHNACIVGCQQVSRSQRAAHVDICGCHSHHLLLLLLWLLLPLVCWQAALASTPASLEEAVAAASACLRLKLEGRQLPSAAGGASAACQQVGAWRRVGICSGSEGEGVKGSHGQAREHGWHTGANLDLGDSMPWLTQ